MEVSHKGAWLGFVVSDSVGKVLLASATFKSFCADVKFAEAWALAEGLNRFVEEGFSKVKIEYDSLNVVTAI